MSFVFYDTETTGTDKSFDQILQFAAVQTDDELNEIDRIEIRCRLLPHVVPSPGAMRVTGLRAAHLADPSIPSHYEMVRAIRAKLLSWSPAVFAGWNSIEFDEHLFRQALYRTLHNPYLTNSSGSSRTDIMRMVQACSIFAPASLTFPLDEKGQKTFKLDRIAPANGFNHDQAHDALGDVQATIFLSRLLKENAPEVWSSFMRFSKKASVVDYITEERVFGLSDFYFGKPYSYLVTSMGNNVENPAEYYVYDLSVDPQSLKPLSERQLAARLGVAPKPMRRLKSNGAPMISPADEVLSICAAGLYGLEELERRAEILQVDSSLRERIITAFESGKKVYSPSPHIEKRIYDGFYEKPDELLMEAFHNAEWSDRLVIVEQFQDNRLRVLGRELIHHERPDLLDDTICREHDQGTVNRLLGRCDDAPWLTLAKALQEVDAMLETATAGEFELLQEHRQYLVERHAKALQA